MRAAGMMNIYIACLHSGREIGDDSCCESHYESEVEHHFAEVPLRGYPSRVGLFRFITKSDSCRMTRKCLR